MIKLDLENLFYAIKFENYVILNHRQFFQFKSVYSMDIFCYFPEKFAKSILRYSNENNISKVECLFNEDKSYSKLILYFDMQALPLIINIHHSMPEFENISLINNYILSVIENAEMINYEHDGANLQISVLSKVDVALLQYINYVENCEFISFDVKWEDGMIFSQYPLGPSLKARINTYFSRKKIDYDAIESNLKFKKGITVGMIISYIEKLPKPLQSRVLTTAKFIYRVFNGRN